MKIIDMIMEHDTINCFEDMEHDVELNQLNDAFYELLEELPEESGEEMECVFSAYMARVIRIAYLKGMKDFAELHMTLKKDIKDFIDEV